MFWKTALELLLPFLAKLSPSTSTPQMPPQFITSITLYAGEISGNGGFVMDVPNKRYIQEIDTPWLGYMLNNTELVLPTKDFNFINGRCVQVNGSFFHDPFSWVRYTKFAGAATLGPEFHSRTCNWWNLSEPALNVSVALCMEKNDTIPVLAAANTGGSTELIYFQQDFRVVVPPASDFDIPTGCVEKAPQCPGGAVVELDAFIFHPQYEFDLYNEDVADLLGDTVFICADANNSQFDHYAWVSRYTLQVWSGWGEYALCNRPGVNKTGNCLGKETYAVGREASYGITPENGRCANNSAVGTWYSLPTAGMCNSTSQQIGPDPTKGHCSWRTLKRIKTIDGDCLLKTNGMFDACNQHYAYPFARPLAILQQSFASDDPSQGGCPPIA